MGLATIEAEVTDHYNSHVRPGFYEVNNAKLIKEDSENPKIDENIPIRRVVTYSIPFVQQVLTGEKIKACGLLELVKPKKGENYYRVVIGYFDSYVGDRRELEYIKSGGKNGTFL